MYFHQLIYSGNTYCYVATTKHQNIHLFDAVFTTNGFHCGSNSTNPEDAPSSFCIARITAKGPCIVIKVAFLGGTEGYIRHEVSKIYTCI